MKRWCTMSLGIILASAISLSTAPAQDCVEYSDYMQWIGGIESPNIGRAVALDGDYAYVAYGHYNSGPNGLQVVNISQIPR